MLVHNTAGLACHISPLVSLRGVDSAKNTQFAEQHSCH